MVAFVAVMVVVVMVVALLLLLLLLFERTPLGTWRRLMTVSECAAGSFTA